MKIALLSPVAWRTPPRRYGPWEQVVSVLAEGLLKEGIDVTLFATSDSLTAGRLVSVIDKPYAEFPEENAKVNECLHISEMMERAAEFDIIHNHFDFLPLTYSRLIGTPMLTTIHGFSSPSILPVYEKYNGHVSYVSISNSDRAPSLNYAATVYNGIDTSLFEFNDRPENYLLFFGRIHPDKGAADAIRVAKAAGKKLILAGLIQDENYFEKDVKPHIDERNVIYAGNCGPAERDKLLRNAEALLHLIHFDEPFGLSVAEAMLCGTPVIAYNRGSMPELIVDGKTGNLVRDEEEAVAAVGSLSSIDREDCRRHAEDKFSQAAMVKGYLEVYNRLLRR